MFAQRQVILSLHSKVIFICQAQDITNQWADMVPFCSEASFRIRYLTLVLTNAPRGLLGLFSQLTIKKQIRLQVVHLHQTVDIFNIICGNSNFFHFLCDLYDKYCRQIIFSLHGQFQEVITKSQHMFKAKAFPLPLLLMLHI